jgi:aminoglycoside/choline kinase family phosphotransferase
LISEREELKAAFLDACGLGQARREMLPGDASTRRYERLYPKGGASLIFMDQPPSAESRPCPPDADEARRVALGYNAEARLAAGRIEAFVACAGYLTQVGLSAPQVFHADTGAGLAVLEDLGDGLYARLILQGEDESELYDAAIDALCRLHEDAPPPVLEAEGLSWPLLDYDDLALKAAGDAFIEWWPRFAERDDFAPGEAARWEAIWSPIRARGAAGASVFCHRDYHAENLIWLPERHGEARVGLLDFQDALRAHPAWDLSMLLHDARRDITPEREADALARYFQRRGDIDQDQFLADYHALGALNIVRILGVFSRLVTRDAKPRYAGYMGRMWTYLDRVLEDPELADLKAFMDEHAPAQVRR